MNPSKSLELSSSWRQVNRNWLPLTDGAAAAKNPLGLPQSQQRERRDGDVPKGIVIGRPGGKEWGIGETLCFWAGAVKRGRRAQALIAMSFIFSGVILPDTVRAVRKGVGEPVTKRFRESLPEVLTNPRNELKLRSGTLADNS